MDKLSSGGIELESFVKDYLKTRSQYYALQMKLRSATDSFSA